MTKKTRHSIDDKPAREDIVKHFNMPLHEAAICLNIPTKALRVLCREYGIDAYVLQTNTLNEEEKLVFSHISLFSLIL